MVADQIICLTCNTASLNNIKKGEDYIILDIDDNLFMIRNNNGELVWINKSYFNEDAEIIQSIKTVSVVEPIEGVTHGKKYSVYKTTRKYYYIIDNNYEYCGYPCEIFKDAKNEKNNIINIDNGLMTNKKEIVNNKNNINNLIVTTDFISLFFVTFIVNSGIGLKIFFAFIVLILNFLFFKVFQPNEEKINIAETLEVKKNYLLSFLDTKTILRIKNLETKVKGIENNPFINGYWVEDILNYIYTALVNGINEEKLSNNCKNKIKEYLDTCEKYLEEKIKYIESGEIAVDKNIENNSIEYIDDKINLLKSATRDLKTFNNDYTL